jgi:membrane protease YdiL (CAAX protease family)
VAARSRRGEAGSRHFTHAVRFILLFYLICFAVRTVESFVIRTDQSVIGELFVNKLFGIALIAVALHWLQLRWRDIGFDVGKMFSGIAIGIAIGCVLYAIGYAVEFWSVRSATSGEVSLAFFVTSYSVGGNAVMNSNAMFFCVCILGNIINVVMEEGVFRGLFMERLARRNGFVKSALISSLLFGLWHIVEPIRDVIDGTSSIPGAAMQSLLLVFAAFIFGLSLCMLMKLTGSLWAGMVIHFINNTSANLLHIVSPSGFDEMQTARIAVAQIILFLATLIVFVIVRRKREARQQQDSGFPPARE